MEMKVFGIKNCDTMKKAFAFLASEGISYTFIDYKKQKPSLALLEQFSKKSRIFRFDQYQRDYLQKND